MIKHIPTPFAVALLLLLNATFAEAQSYNADGSNKASTGQSKRTVMLAPEETKAERDLILRQQQRMDLFDTDLKNLRGSVEEGFRILKMQVGQLSSSTSTDESEISARIRSLQDNIERLTDTLAMTNRRIEHTLEITSDVEFRLLRLEKRMQTLMTLVGPDLVNSVVADDSLPAEPSEQITIQRKAGDGTINWSVDENKLSQQLNDGNDAIASKNTVTDSAEETTLLDASGAAQTMVAADSANPTPARPSKPAVLPDESPDEQYRFALGKALQNDLETAESAFAEFRVINKGHSREADAAFWLGRVQYMRGSYEKAAMTFSEFNSEYPNDARLVDTTMWIAESVSHFAPQDQACAIYASLPSLLDSPPESFTAQLAELSIASNCDS